MRIKSGTPDNDNFFFIKGSEHYTPKSKSNKWEWFQRTTHQLLVYAMMGKSK
jgi:hypothetical protein